MSSSVLAPDLKTVATLRKSLLCLFRVDRDISSGRTRGRFKTRWDPSLSEPATRPGGNSRSNASVHSVGGAHASPNPSGHLDAMVSRRKGKEREREKADERSKTNRVFTDTVIRLDGRERALPNPTRCKFSVSVVTLLSRDVSYKMILLVMNSSHNQ